MSEENKAALRRMMDMFLTGDVGAADELVSPDCLDHQEMPGVDSNGVEGFKRVVAIYRDAFSDLSIEYIALIAEGDRVVAQVRMRGKNTGSFMGLPATGKPVDVEIVDIVRMKDGKAVEHWGYAQEAKMMQQLGLGPA